MYAWWLWTVWTAYGTNSGCNYSYDRRIIVNADLNTWQFRDDHLVLTIWSEKENKPQAGEKAWKHKQWCGEELFCVGKRQIWNKTGSFFSMNLWQTLQQQKLLLGYSTIFIILMTRQPDQTDRNGMAALTQTEENILCWLWASSDWAFLNQAEKREN